MQSSAKLVFEVHEIKELDDHLDAFDDDIDVELYHYMASQEKHLINTDLMRILDFGLAEAVFAEQIKNLWLLYRAILSKNPSAKQFDRFHFGIIFRRVSYAEIDALAAVYTEHKQENEFETTCKTFVFIIIRSIRQLLLQKLSGIIFKIITVANPESVQVGTLSNYDVYVFGGSTLCTMLHIFYGMRSMNKDKQKLYVRLIKALCINTEHELYSKVNEQLRYENRGHMYVLIPTAFKVVSAMCIDAWKQFNLSLLVHKCEPDFDAVITRYIKSVSFAKRFMELHSVDDREKHGDVIMDIFKLFVTRCCSKLLYVSTKQLQLNELGMSLRDQFKYEAIKRQAMQRKNCI